MALLGQLPFASRYGNPTATTRTMLLYSLVNTAMSVVCNGATYPVTLVAVGTDNSAVVAQAGFVGEITISGLSAGVSYPYTITQGSNSRSGNIAPFFTGTEQDYSFFILACDNPVAWVTGMYPPIKNYVLNGPLSTTGYFHSDDLGYVDSSVVDDVTNGLGVHKSTGTPFSTLKEYDYALGYLAHLGLFADTTTVYATGFGQDEFRVWLRENQPLMPQWGNHELDGYMGTMGVGAIDVPTGARPNAYHKTASPGYDGAALMMWNAFFKPLQPSAEMVKTNAPDANHWGITLPNVQVVAPDNITHSSGAVSTQAYGPLVIDDTLAYLDTTVPFKIMLMNHSVRGLGANNQGAHYALENYVPNDYKRMFTAPAGATPKSIMANPNTNGRVGVTVLVHGDYHVGQVARHGQVLSGQETELLYSINGATVNGSSGHGAYGVVGHTYSATAGEAATGTTLLYRRPEDTMPAPVTPYVVRVDIYGSKPVKEMVISLLTESAAEPFGAVAWSGRWLERSSNEVVPAGWEAPQLLGSSSL